MYGEGSVTLNLSNRPSKCNQNAAFRPQKVWRTCLHKKVPIVLVSFFDILVDANYHHYLKIRCYFHREFHRAVLWFSGRKICSWNHKAQKITSNLRSLYGASLIFAIKVIFAYLIGWSSISIQGHHDSSIINLDLVINFL